MGSPNKCASVHQSACHRWQIFGLAHSGLGLAVLESVLEHRETDQCSYIRYPST